MKGSIARKGTVPRRVLLLVATLTCLSVNDSTAAVYDLVLRHGLVYDGSGRAPIAGDVAIQGDRIAAIGDLSTARGGTEIDVSGMAVAPGFITTKLNPVQLTVLSNLVNFLSCCIHKNTDYSRTWS